MDTILRSLREGLIEQGKQSNSVFAVGEHVGEPDAFQCYPELYENIRDNITGVTLDSKLVAQARREEMQLLFNLGIYEYASSSDCFRKTGRKPIPSKWVDINKGDDVTPKVRSRWVIAETKHNTNIDVKDPSATFSATPPYECSRFLISLMMTLQTNAQKSYQ